MKEEQYKRLEKYEGLAVAWMDAVSQDSDLTIAGFLEGKIEGSEREKALETICDYVTYHYLLFKGTAESLVRISKVESETIESIRRRF